MIKVLNIVSDTNIGGAGRVILNYLRCQDTENFKTYVAVPKGSMLIEQLEKTCAVVLEVDGIADKSYDKSDIAKLEALIKEIKPDIVHTHGSLSGRIAAKNCGCKVVYTRHSAFPLSWKMKSLPGRLVNRYVAKKYSDKIIAVGPAAEENLLGSGISKSMITTMMNGVSPVAKLKDDEIARVKEEYGITDEFVILLLARIEEYKGHLSVVDAAKMLKDAGRKFKIIFAGEGSFEPVVREKVKELGLEDEVIFTGFVRDVEKVLSIADIQVNASINTETSSLSILEGFSMGLPAIVSSSGGNPMLVKDGYNGLIFEAGSSKQLYDAFIRVIADKDIILPDMGAHALERYKNEFTGEAFAKKVEKLYRDCLEGK